ncbi:ArnT family glycosyltransferase [Sphingomonas oligophenolica]|uniref:Uncharacterized protein n=1 Tax=Sphingomonas oligophenolica TaxID=301154 RepID=A0A502BZT1_9SPHN|nr:glycosyltransferase family 39 protein [Sphingomonas oligophenolica]TPG06022.1 hypothetical protein EAH84_15010 [Sphingomonas oligophenolica]
MIGIPTRHTGTGADNPGIGERWFIVSLLILVACIARAQTFGNPVIGFDEQFYAVVGDRLRQGALPFVDIFDRKPVGLFLIYAASSALGANPLLQYKLVALAFVAATAFLIYAIGRRNAGALPSVLAAVLYIAWLNFMEGEGGQSPVLYNLPMVAAAAIIIASSRQASPRRTGVWAMAIVGLAIQIKYSVIPEGIYFGCWLIVRAWRRGERGSTLATSIAAWVSIALLPTALAFGGYAAAGHAKAFIFANFLSVFAQGGQSIGTQVAGISVILGILALPALFVIIGWRGRTRLDLEHTPFLLGWLFTAIASLVLYGRFASPHYALPVLLPLTCLIAPVIGAGPNWRRSGMLLALVGLIGGQIVLATSESRKGGRREAEAVARAAHTDGRGCIYVYDGYPALYLLTHSCLPTRWSFPGHLNTAEEANPAALGVDPTSEVARILATHPIAIIDDFPRFSGGNRVTHRLLQQALDDDYTLAACVPTGPHRVRLVYRLKSEGVPRPRGCPDRAALRLGR